MRGIRIDTLILLSMGKTVCIVLGMYTQDHIMQYVCNW